jgi:hypothetical protein
VVEHVRGQHPRGVQLLPVRVLLRCFLSWLTLLPSSSAAATALERSRGCFVAMSSTGAQVRIPGTSDMNLSKFATNRLIEFIVLGSFCLFILRGNAQPDSLRCAEYPSVRAFVLSPGVVRTRLLIEAKAGEPLNTVALPAATTLYLTSGRADWLSGRSVDHPSRVF